MTSFADLGTPFPLFEGPVDDASEFVGAGDCSLCGKHSRVCFELGIGGAVMRECPTCGTLNGLDASDGEPIDCRACQQLVVFPDLPDTIVACYACVRQGRAALSKDTQLGMISWEQAFDGVTHGGPGLSNPAFDLVPREGGWVGARLPQATMFELLRTPTYSTIQGERWPFCCRAPMVFLGRWSRDHFNRQAADGDGHTLFQAMVANPVPGLWEDQLHDVTGIYAFRCPACDRRMAHWDIA